MSTDYNPNGSFDLREQDDETNDEEGEEGVTSFEDALTPDEQRKDVSDVGKRVIDHAPIDCPNCGSELDPSPYARWTCWSCRNHVFVQGGGGR